MIEIVKCVIQINQYILLIEELLINIFVKKYDFVSLLIGVNDQYRGRSKAEYAQQFEKLLIQALQLVGNFPQHVFVLSIPRLGRYALC